MDEYSQAEKRLFEALGLGHLISRISVSHLYKIAVENAFTDDKKGDEIEVLRRGVKAFYSGKINRMTPEYDELITFNRKNT